METQGLHQQEARFLAFLAILQGTAVLPLSSADTQQGSHSSLYSVGFQSLLRTGQHPGCCVSSASSWTPRTQAGGLGGDCQAQLGKVQVKIPLSTLTLPKQPVGGSTRRSQGLTFQEWPVPPTSTLPLSKARVEKDTMKRRTVWSAAASLPPTLWPAFEPQRVRVCVCVSVCVSYMRA